MKMKKRVWSILLVLCMMLTLMPVGAFAFSTGYPNTYVNSGTQAADIAGVARTQIGYVETSGNHTKYNYWYYNGNDTSAAWCAIFISWCADQAGIPTSIIAKNARASGYTTSNMNSNPFRVPAVSFSNRIPAVGDIAFIDNSGDNNSDHVGIVIGVDGNYIYTAEGNYSNKVANNKYARSNGKLNGTSSTHIVFFAVPNYQNTTPTPTPTPNRFPDPEFYPDDFYAYIVVEKPWKSLGVNGYNVEITDTGRSDPREIWHFVRLSSGRYHIINEYNGLYLNCDNAGTWNGTNVNVWNYTGDLAQEWWHYYNYDGWYSYLTPGTCEKVIDADNENLGKGSNAQLWDFNGTPAQQLNIYKLTQDGVNYQKPGRPDASNLIGDSGFQQGKESTLTWNASPDKGSYDERDYEVRIYDSNQNLIQTIGSLGSATSCKYTFNAAGTYYVEVTAINTMFENYSTAGNRTAVQVKLPGVTIASQPQNYVGKANSTASFTVAAEGDGLTYQWQISDDGGKTWSNSSVKNPKYSTKLTEAKDGRMVRCIVTDQYGSSVTSDAATMKFQKELSITTQPKNTTGKEGTTAKFTVKAVGDGLTYQWQYSDNGGQSWKNSSVKNPSYSTKLTSDKDGRMVRCMVTDQYGSFAISDAATMKISDLAITTQPKNYVGKVNSTAKFTVAAEGNGLTYQWQISDDGFNWANSSVKAASYSTKLTTAKNGRMVRCIVTDANGNSVTSSAATMKIG